MFNMGGGGGREREWQLYSLLCVYGGLHVLRSCTKIGATNVCAG